MIIESARSVEGRRHAHTHIGERVGQGRSRREAEKSGREDGSNKERGKQNGERGRMRGRRWAFRGPAMITGSANLYYTLAISLLPLPFFMGAPLFPSFLFYLPFFSLRPPFLRRVTLSLSLSLSPSSFLLSLSQQRWA